MYSPHDFAGKIILSCTVCLDNLQAESIDLLEFALGESADYTSYLGCETAY